MTFKEYIREYHPIKEQIQNKFMNPVKFVMEKDDLPCDDVKAVDGVLQKVVYVNSEEYVSVLDILSYTKEDIDKMPDSDFKTTWLTYMEYVEVTDVDIRSILELSKEYLAAKKKKEVLTSKCIE